jgi:hypothetical protein
MAMDLAYKRGSGISLSPFKVSIFLFVSKDWMTLQMSLVMLASLLRGPESLSFRMKLAL